MCGLSPGVLDMLEAHDMYGLYALTQQEYQTRGDSEIQRGTLATPTKNQPKINKKRYRVNEE